MTHPTDPPPGHQTTDMIPQLCCHCGGLTRRPVLVGEAYTPSGAGRSIYACPADAPLFGERYAGPAA
ncbi:hypothetical protein [Streptomyces sp. SID10815]|uniref:hypothetical protein n=1 Tax=Streptomyces sp. SID10815 TaxID=2706027 RepID=UPI0013CD934C|nr:hypothetical protein [Streptomyces sp. SID10815]NEA48446.1 hypothetical protein [Streptomyces sp. SID10815]